MGDAAHGSVAGSANDGGLGEPFFADEVDGITNVTAQLGITTYLHCRVNSLGGKMASLSHIEVTTWKGFSREHSSAGVYNFRALAVRASSLTVLQNMWELEQKILIWGA